MWDVYIRIDTQKMTCKEEGVEIIPPLSES